MEKDVQLGTVGQLKATFSAGVGKLEIAMSHPSMPGLQGGAFVQDTSDSVLDQLFALIEKISPAGLVAIEEKAKETIKAYASKL